MCLQNDDNRTSWSNFELLPLKFDSKLTERRDILLGKYRDRRGLFDRLHHRRLMTEVMEKERETRMRTKYLL